MKKFLFFLAFICIGQTAFSQAEVAFKEEVQTPVPVITFDKNTYDLGDVKKGETRQIEYTFKNTGTDFLEIELVTSCHCTTIDWPKGPVAPGADGKITVTYDSTEQKMGQIKKTIDIICNTDPIVVEAFFHVNVTE